MEKSSFTKEIKDEITSLEFSSMVNMSLLSAFLKCNGTLKVHDKKEIVVLKTENAQVAKYIYNLLKKEFKGVNLTFTFRKNMRFNKSYEYLINIFSMVDEIFEKLELDFLSSKIPLKLTNKDEKVRGYAIGLFLCSGSCSNPISSNYHFEIYTHDEEYSKNIVKLFNKIKVYPFEFKEIKRRNNYVVYLKKSEQIASFLAYMDANNCSLTYEGYRLDRDLVNYTNRQANLDVYNYKKSIKKSEELIKIINLIDDRIGIDNIYNEKIRELCKLRKENPEASYNDLASLLSEKLSKKVSKSNINHLIIKIKEMGERLNER